MQIYGHYLRQTSSPNLIDIEVALAPKWIVFFNLYIVNSNQLSLSVSVKHQTDHPSVVLVSL